MGSGLIYAVIIGMWVAYFIPLWLRRHEERAEARSADRFSHAMRILSRRHSDADNEDPSAAPGRSHATRAHSVGTAPRPVAPPPHRRPTAGRRRPSKLAFRRRRILATLLIVTIAVTAATPLAAVTWQMAAGAAGATLLYVIHLRVQTRRSREVSRTRRSIRRRSLARLSRLESAERIFNARRVLRAERAAAAEELAAKAAVAAPDREPQGWQPVPVPLPTYVTKPTAPPAAAGARPAASEPFDQTADATQLTAPPRDADVFREVIERRRAVND